MKIAVLLSGGVDSSLSLVLAIQRYGNQAVEAFYLKIWLENELSYLANCPWDEDLRYARELTQRYGIPLHIVNLQEDYFEKVVTYTLEALKEGLTPSPDIFCNNFIKFGSFLERIHSDYALIVTGHYAQLHGTYPHIQLHQGIDPIKDQSYFLAGLTQEQLKRIEFPIGHLHKRTVRLEAQKLELPSQDRKDSQGICFLGKFSYHHFVKHYLGVQKGPFIHYQTQQQVGEHQGYWFYTIGQRRGLGLGGGPWYVLDKDTSRNIVWLNRVDDLVVQNENNFIASKTHWIDTEAPERTRLGIKLRHGPSENYAQIQNLPNGDLLVMMEKPDKGIAPGQFVIFYQGTSCLGLAMIQKKIFLEETL